MFTETMLRENPALVKAFTGVPADQFWAWYAQMESEPKFEEQRLLRTDRQRALGGGRDFDQPLALRVIGVLTYLRLHAPQTVVGLMYGLTQSDISRDVRRVLPLIQTVLSCPAVWKVVENDHPVSDLSQVTLEQLTDGRALVDATEQRVSRPSDNDTRKRYYSGKKKAFTLKTQMVTEGNHHIVAISEAVPGAEHDKKLSDDVKTIERLPDGCEADADKGYQGMADQVSLVTIRQAETGIEQVVPRLTVHTPFKKPKGKELTAEQKTFNQQLGAIRVRVEHCIGWAKNWAILATRFRCAKSIYTSVMQTICGLVNAQTQCWQTAESG